MSTENGAAAEVAVETTTTPAEEPGFSSQESVETNPVEDKARKDGWVPKDEWEGDPKNWKDADTFVAHGERIKADREVEARIAKIEKVNAVTMKRIIALKDAEIAALKTEKVAAIEAGDVKEVERIEGEIEAKQADDADILVEEEDDGLKGLTPEQKVKYKADVAAFKTVHPWYETDPEMTEYANKVSKANAALNPGISFDDNVKFAADMVQGKFGEARMKGAQPKGLNGHAPVDGGGSLPGGVKSDPLGKLPAEARAQAKSDMAKYPKVYPTPAAWIAAYNS